MARTKASQDTIYKGQFYPAGAELPEDHAELSQGKSRLGAPGGNYASQVGAARGLPQHQENRPGMSGSGKPQTADIVDEEGHVTKQGEGEGEEGKAKKDEKAKK